MACHGQRNPKRPRRPVQLRLILTIRPHRGKPIWQAVVACRGSAHLLGSPRLAAAFPRPRFLSALVNAGCRRPGCGGAIRCRLDFLPAIKPMPETPHDPPAAVMFLRMAAAQLRSIINEGGDLGEPQRLSFAIWPINARKRRTWPKSTGSISPAITIK